MRTSSDYIWKVLFVTSDPEIATREQWIELELQSASHANGLLELIRTILEKYDKGELNAYLAQFSKAPWDNKTMDMGRIIGEELTVVRAETPASDT